MFTVKALRLWDMKGWEGENPAENVYIVVADCPVIMKVFCVNCRFINRAICHLIVNLLVNYSRKSSKTYENAQKI